MPRPQKIKRKKKKEKQHFCPCASPPSFLPILGRKHFSPFFFPILPKIHQTKQTLRVPIFIKSHSKQLNKRWASIPKKIKIKIKIKIKKKKKERKKERKRKKKNKKKKKKKMGIYQILLRYSFALIPSLLIFIKFHTKQLNKRWAPIKFFYAARLLLFDLCWSICPSTALFLL